MLYRAFRLLCCATVELPYCLIALLPYCLFALLREAHTLVHEANTPVSYLRMGGTADRRPAVDPTALPSSTRESSIIPKFHHSIIPLWFACFGC